MLLLFAALHPVPCWAAPGALPKLAVDPVPDTAELESHADALRRWATLGITGASLLHVDARARTGGFPEAQAASLGALRRALASGESPAAAFAAYPEQAHLNLRFARAAVSLGIARETYWIMPYDYFTTPDPATSLRADMQGAGFRDEDVRTFSLRDGCYRGTVEGAPFAVCDLQHLPAIEGPVLASLDATFVLVAAEARPGNPMDEVRRLLAALSVRGYAVADAVVYPSPGPGGGPAASPDLRWIGEAVAQALRDPGLLSRPGGVRRWSVLQSFAAALSRGLHADVLHEVIPYLTAQEDDPALHLYAAEALAGLNRVDEALGHARKACGLHKAYCAGLPWIGIQRLDVGDPQGAERFFTEGLRLRPGMAFGQVARGISLQRAGRPDEALAAFAIAAEGGDPFSAAFLAGSVLLEKGDRQAARKQFDRAVEALSDVRGEAVTLPELARAVRDAARFYREEQQPRQAELLEDGTRLVLPGAEPARRP
jgi:tetratricopeptide (TPR) repeat protein